MISNDAEFAGGDAHPVAEVARQRPEMTQLGLLIWFGCLGLWGWSRRGRGNGWAEGQGQGEWALTQIKKGHLHIFKARDFVKFVTTITPCMLYQLHE